MKIRATPRSSSGQRPLPPPPLGLKKEKSGEKKRIKKGKSEAHSDWNETKNLIAQRNLH